MKKLKDDVEKVDDINFKLKENIIKLFDEAAHEVIQMRYVNLE